MDGYNINFVDGKKTFMTIFVNKFLIRRSEAKQLMVNQLIYGPGDSINESGTAQPGDLWCRGVYTLVSQSSRL